MVSYLEGFSLACHEGCDVRPLLNEVLKCYCSTKLTRQYHGTKSSHQTINVVIKAAISLYKTFIEYWDKHD